MLRIVSLLLVISLVKSQQTCVCDLTFSSCDTNCCCDSDCTSNDTATFSFCLSSGFTPDNQQCIYNQVVFTNNIPTTVQVQQDGLFCISTDNFAERNFYVSPACVADNSCFDQVSSTFSFQQEQKNSVTGEAFYMSGDPIYIIFKPLPASNSTPTGYFSLPTNGVSNLCQNGPVRYLQSSSSACTQTVSTSQPCLNNPALGCSFYYQDFKVAPTPAIFNQSINSQDPYNDPDLLPVILTSPSESACVSDCSEMVDSISYKFVTDGINGIVNVSVDITLAAGSTSTSLTQSFTLLFEDTNTTSVPIQKSGNPGYLVGRPLIAGSVSNTSGIVVNLNPNSEITVVLPSDNNLCSSKTPILFGQDLRTGCKLTFSTNQTCAEIQNQINLVLAQDTFSNRTIFVAAFGNTSVSDQDLNQWVDVSVVNAAGSDPAGNFPCSNMIVGAQYEFLYAYSGDVSNPQAQIIGARYQYDPPQQLDYVCFKSNCNNANPSVEITVSVSFLDVSETPVSEYKAAPQFSAKLPNDFFFPFRSHAVLPKHYSILLWVALAFFRTFTL